MKVKKYQQLFTKDRINNTNLNTNTNTNVNTNVNMNLSICVDGLVKKIEYKQSMWHIAIANIKDNKIYI